MAVRSPARKRPARRSPTPRTAAAKRGRAANGTLRAPAGGSKRRGAATTGAKAPVRFAVVGLGYFAQAAVLPAFAHAPNAKLVALVSEDEAKLQRLARRYGATTVVGYDGYDALLRSGAVDAVYITMPNDLHRDFAVRAAEAGVHVLCEKPMALSVDECRAMQEAADRNGVRLMVAYRLHFEAANLEAAALVRGGRIGEPRLFSSTFSFQVKAGNIRTQAARGGGPLYDIGLYCINAARYLFGAEPTSVLAATARSDDPRFAEVEEAVSAILRFPGERLAAFTASFGAADVGRYLVVGTKGSLSVDPAYEFAGGLEHQMKVGERTTRRKFPKRDQVAPELEHFAACVRSGRDPEPSGKEGLIDIAIVEAIQRSAHTGQEIQIHAPERHRRPTRRQEARKPPHGMPDLVHADTPHS